MKTKSFFTNKYIIGVLLILVVISVDVFLHPGMSRVMFPKHFSDSLQPQYPTFCDQSLTIKSKHWLKAVNSLEKLQVLDSSVAGIEMDIYFDEDLDNFFVYHDSSDISQTVLYDMMNLYRSRNLEASIWLDFKNLSKQNQRSSLEQIKNLRSEFGLQNKMIIESSNIKSLKPFCDAGFFTSYYIPFFNPYEMGSDAIGVEMNHIRELISIYPPSALSGYYFQIPLLSKYFPEASLLTWAESDRYSLVAPLFNADLLSQKQVKIVLYDEVK